jgi:pimeloyl-ACP methyl ester carboxylesterase
MNTFQGPMQPFPGLERWSCKVKLPVSNIYLHFYDTGEKDKTPVVLLHGLGDEADTWRHVISSVSAKHRVIAPDLPGFGRSEKGKLKYTIPFFVDVLLELFDALSISRAVLVGHSNGALIAHTFALEHPDHVERLVLISGSLVLKENRFDPGLLLFLLPGLGEWMYNRLRKDPQAAYRTLKPYYYSLEDLPQVDRDFLYQRVNERVWSDGQRQGFLSTLRNLVKWIPSQQKNLPARLRQLRIPTNIIWGEHDRINSVANAHALVDVLPASRLVIVSGAGHNVHQENAEVVVMAVTEDLG